LWCGVAQGALGEVPELRSLPVGEM